MLKQINLLRPSYVQRRILPKYCIKWNIKLELVPTGQNHDFTLSSISLSLSIHDNMMPYHHVLIFPYAEIRYRVFFFLSCVVYMLQIKSILSIQWCVAICLIPTYSPWPFEKKKSTIQHLHHSYIYPSLPLQLPHNLTAYQSYITNLKNHFLQWRGLQEWCPKGR